MSDYRTRIIMALISIRPGQGGNGISIYPIFFTWDTNIPIKCKKVDTKYIKKNTDVTPLYTEYQEFSVKNTKKYPHFGKKIPNTLVKNTQDTVFPKPLAGPDRWQLQRSAMANFHFHFLFKFCRSLNFFQASFSAISLIAVYSRGSIRYLSPA